MSDAMMGSHTRERMDEMKNPSGAPYIRVAHSGFPSFVIHTPEHWFISLVLNVGQTGQRPAIFYLSIQSILYLLVILISSYRPAASIFYVNSKYLISVGNFKWHILIFMF